jgi:hypothetical protein
MKPVPPKLKKHILKMLKVQGVFIFVALFTAVRLYIELINGDPFLLILGPYAVWLLGYGFLLIANIINAIRWFTKYRWAGFLPILVSLIGAVLFAVVVLTAFVFWTEPSDFEHHYHERMEVVEKVESGELAGSRVTLPWRYRDVVTKNRIHVERENGVLYVLFPTHIFFGYEGFVYSSDGKMPPENLISGEFVSLEHVEGPWYKFSGGD